MAQNNAYTLSPAEQYGLVPRVREEKKQAERSELGSGYPEPSSGAGSSVSEPISLRQRLAAARRAMDLKQRAKDKFQEKVMAPARMGTSMALKMGYLDIKNFYGRYFRKFNAA